jgi:hypothetical protein
MTAAVPSIKGSALQAVVDDLQALRSSGRLAPDALEARLDAAALRLLDQKVAAARWYPVDAYGQLLAVLRDAEGGSDPQAYLRQRGQRAAQRLIDSGLYRQLDASERRWGEAVGRVMITLAPLMYNFSRWSIVTRDDKRGFRIEVAEAGPLPEPSVPVLEGFIETMVNRALEEGARVRAVRERPDLLVVHVERLRTT